MLGFAFIVGDDIVAPLCGIVAGHIYFFCQEVLPEADGPLKGYRVLATPNFLYSWLQLPSTAAAAANIAMHAHRNAAAGGPAAAPVHRWPAGGQRLG